MSSNPLLFRWDLVLIYVLFKFLQGGGTGGMGVLNNLRTFLWIKIQQYTTREVEASSKSIWLPIRGSYTLLNTIIKGIFFIVFYQVNLFRHIHTLSLKWHLSKKTGELTRMMDRGTDSINNILNYVLFSITPSIVDILVAIFYFVTYFNAYFGIIVFVTMSLYLGNLI